MLTRRAFSRGLTSLPLIIYVSSSIADPLQEDESDLAVPFDQLVYPSFEELDAPSTFGYREPNEQAKAKAADLIKLTPKGPRPIDAAQSFVDRCYKTDPTAISQWPAPDAWNPLIVEFFGATSRKVKQAAAYR